MNNGRINLEGPEIKHQFEMFDKIPVESYTFHDAMTGNFYKTELSNLFFSSKNIDIIQNGIRAEVYSLSKNKHIIDRQNQDELNTIMRSIFLSNSKNLPNDITSQIETLNNKVINEISPKLLGEVIGYLNYRRDISQIPVPLTYAKSTMDNSKSLEFKHIF
jgi:hypothetical protein|tara:strand:+ start:335 stop:817 length:483 start_codon:yes stop_codon:yes gene_type:complete